MPLTQYLVCKGQLRKEVAARFENFLQEASREEVKTMITNFTSNLDLNLNDSLRRKGTWNNRYSQNAVDSARSFGNYADYVKGITENTINSNAAVAIHAAYHDKKDYVIQYDLEKLETKYEVGDKIMTFEEVLNSMNEISQMAKSTVRIAKPRGAYNLVASIEGTTANVLEQEGVDIDKVKGVVTRDLANTLLEGKLGMAPVDLLNNMGAPDNNLKCKVDGVMINLEMKTNTFHRGVDIHEILPNGRVKKEVFNTLNLDSDLDDRARKLYTERILAQRDVEPGTCIFFNFSWLVSWKQNNPGWSIDILDSWYPVIIPGSAEICLRKLDTKVQVWNNSQTMMILVRMAKRIHYLWCLLRSLKEKISIKSVVRIMVNNMGVTYQKPLLYMFSLFDKSYKIDVKVSRDQANITDVVVGYVSKLKVAMDRDMSVFDKLVPDEKDEEISDTRGKTRRIMDFNLDDESFLGKKKEQVTRNFKSRLHDTQVIKEDESVRRDISNYSIHQEKMRELPDKHSVHYGKSTEISDKFVRNPPNMVQTQSWSEDRSGGYEMREDRDRSIRQYEIDLKKDKGYIQEGIDLTDKVNNNYSPSHVLDSRSDVQENNPKEEDEDFGVNITDF